MNDLSAVMKPFYLISKSVAQNPVMQVLIACGAFNMEADVNILLLPSDARLAAATGVALYVDPVPLVAAKQNEILNTFAATPALTGWTNLSLLQADVSSLPPPVRQARDQVFANAKKLADDLRDYTGMNIVQGRLRLG
jgi:cellulase/cellobiase CelA1